MSNTILTRRRAMAGLAALPAAAVLGSTVLGSGQAHAADATVIEARTDRAMNILYSQVRGSRELAARAKGVLIMPEIAKAGFVVGGAYGEGALRINGATVGYFSLAAASFGFQAGIQKSSQALFFMTTNALEQFRRADGWELSAGAEVTVPDEGLNLEVNTTVTNRPVIAITFGQEGLMAGVSFEGAKYSRIVR
jgi:lipid-binding SYLF domain-containing protein